MVVFRGIAVSTLNPHPKPGIYRASRVSTTCPIVEQTRRVMEVSAIAQIYDAIAGGEVGKTEAGLNVLLIGCGRLGSALLAGLMSNVATWNTISRIHVAVRSADGRSRVEQIMMTASNLEKSRVNDLVIIIDSTKMIEAISVTDIVILACGHNDYQQILQNHATQQGFQEKGKNITVVSMLGGVSSLQLHQTLYAGTSTAEGADNTCVFVRALPNVAVRVRQSITALSAKSFEDDIDRIFRLVGETIWLPEEQMNTAGALGASSLAFFATIVEALSDGVSTHPNRLSSVDTLSIASSASRGVAALLAAGQNPEQIRQSVISPKGSTAKGMQVMHDLGVPEALKQAMYQTVSTADSLVKK